MALAFLSLFSGDSWEVTVLYLGKDMKWKKNERKEKIDPKIPNYLFRSTR